MQQDGFDISLFPKKDTPVVSQDFDVTMFPKKTEPSAASMDMTLFPKKVQPEKKKTVEEKIAGSIGSDFSNPDLPTMAEIYEYGATGQQDPDIEQVNPLSNAFLFKIPDPVADQVADTPEAQFQLQQEGLQVAKMVREQESAQWNSMTAEQKEAYLKSAMGGDMSRAATYGNVISGTVLKLAADVPKWSGIITRQFDKWITGDSKPKEAYAAYLYGMKAQEAINEMFPTNQKYAQAAAGQLIQGTASLIPYIFTGSWVAAMLGATRAAVPSAVAVGFLGAAQNSVPEYDKLVEMHRDAHDMEQRDFLSKWSQEGKVEQDLIKTYNKLAADTGMAEDFAWQGFIANSLTGVTEGLPLGWGMNNIKRFLGPTWTTKLVSALEAGGMEGFQEGLTEYVANMSAIQAYDFTRRWQDNVAQSGGMGAMIGLVTFGIAGGLARQLEDPNLDPRKKAIILKAIEENQKAEAMVPADPNEIVPPKTTEKTAKVRKKRIKHVVETVENPPRTDQEKTEVLDAEAKLAAEEKATLGNPDAVEVTPVQVDPTPVAEEELPEGSKKKKPHRYFSSHGDQTGLTSHKRKDSNFTVTKEGEVDIIEGKESTIIQAQAYNPLYEATNMPQSPDDAINVVTKPVVDPKTGDVLKRGELYFGDTKPTKKKATEDMANKEMADQVQKLIETGEITYTDDNGKPCAVAGGRMGAFTRGGKWTVVKDLKGYPSHAKGGVDLQITPKGVMFKNNVGKEIHAKHGLVICK